MPWGGSARDGADDDAVGRGRAPAARRRWREWAKSFETNQPAAKQTSATSTTTVQPKAVPPSLESARFAFVTVVAVVVACVVGALEFAAVVDVRSETDGVSAAGRVCSLG